MAITDKVLLTREQKSQVAGMEECVALFNTLSKKLTDSGLKVDTSAWADGHISVVIVRDVREIEIEIGGSNG